MTRSLNLRDNLCIRRLCDGSTSSSNNTIDKSSSPWRRILGYMRLGANQEARWKRCRCEKLVQSAMAWLCLQQMEMLWNLSHFTRLLLE
ncbi:unnamed protein product [Sphenostylis stenocarpa]|uniref:Uncharacterized protein n=1 Tax=Sphenostylis stenocarpa TaxID=92480 RepID=A0AA86VYR7_9FABA|nr:unnamed protein product [Sphenostylis stenocarpa]